MARFLVPGRMALMVGATLAAFCTSSSCTSSSALVVDGVDPGVVPEHLPTAVTIHGEGFLGVVAIDLDEGDSTALETQFSAYVGDVAITPVERLDDRHLGIVVPAGLPLGAHDVEVVAPSGDRAVAVDALMVVSAEDCPDGACGGAGGAGGSGGAGGGVVGPCGKDCLGGECLDGVCQPVVLVTGQPGIVGVTASATHLFWTTGPNSKVMRQPLDGSAPPEQIRDAGGRYVSYIDIHSSRLFWPESPSYIYSSTLDGSNRQELADDLGNPTGLEATGTFVYSTEYTAQGLLFTVDHSGGVVAKLEGPLSYPEEIAVAANGDLYFTVNAAGIVARRTAQLTPGLASETLLSGLDQPSGIAVDESHVYYCTEGPGEVSRLAHGATVPELLAQSPQPTGIVLTDDALIWGDFTDGTIRRLAK